MKKFASLLLTLAITVGAAGTAAAAAADGGSGSEAASGPAASDAAVMYRVPHVLQLELAPKGQSGTMDGKPLDTDVPIMRGGRAFVSVRTLRQTGSATVQWDAAKREVRVAVSPRLMAPLPEVRFRIGSDTMYWKDGTPLADQKIPAPFLSGGRVYIPVKAFRSIGIDAAASDDRITLKWSDKVIEVLRPKIETDGAVADFTVLYQQDMYTPQIMTSMGIGGWLGLTGHIVDKDVSMDGRVYNRIRFEVPLRPGVNPLQIFGISAAVTAKIEAVRRVADPSAVPVQLSEEGKDMVSFDEPSSGYLQVKAGEPIAVSGDILRHNDLFDKLKISAQIYGNGGYREVSRTEVPIEDRKFSGSLALKDPGTYLIVVYSPAYIPFPESGPASTEWAEFVVEVK